VSVSEVLALKRPLRYRRVLCVCHGIHADPETTFRNDVCRFVRVSGTFGIGVRIMQVGPGPFALSSPCSPYRLLACTPVAHRTYGARAQAQFGPSRTFTWGPLVETLDYSSYRITECKQPIMTEIVSCEAW
jgi:hypothetical protein